jgi:hypothetical protein
MWSKMYWMIGVAVVTIPEGIVKGPDRVLPKNSVVKVAGSSFGFMGVGKSRKYTVSAL